MPRAKRVRQIFMDATEPDFVQTETMRRWTVRVWVMSKGNIHASEYLFWSEAKHQGEAYELLYANGFCCVRKNHLGLIVPAANLNVRVSTGEL